MTNTWTADRVERLQELWRAGDSASIIGRKLGCSRNTVLGKVHRLRQEGVHFAERTLNMRRLYRRIESGQALSPWKKIRRNAASPRRQAPPPRHADLPPAGEEPPLNPPMMKRKPLMELQRHECRFPLWGPNDTHRLCCGNLAVPGKPYCASHARQAFMPVKKRERRNDP